MYLDLHVHVLMGIYISGTDKSPTTTSKLQVGGA